MIPVQPLKGQSARSSALCGMDQRQRGPTRRLEGQALGFPAFGEETASCKGVALKVSYEDP